MPQDVFVLRLDWTEDSILERLFLTRAAVVADILNEQVPVADITAILQCNPEEHVCDDVTETIARAVANEAEQRQAAGDDITLAVRDFIEKHAGLAWARGLRVAA